MRGRSVRIALGRGHPRTDLKHSGRADEFPKIQRRLCKISQHQAECGAEMVAGQEIQNGARLLEKFMSFGKEIAQKIYNRPRAQIAATLPTRDDPQLTRRWRMLQGAQLQTLCFAADEMR